MPSHETLDLRTALRAHLATSGQSAAALDRDAAVRTGVVSKILREPNYAPPRPIVAALEGAVGHPLPSPFAAPRRTWAQVRDEIAAADPSDPRLSRIRWLMRETGWIAESRIADRRDVIEWFARSTPAAHRLSPSSWPTYKSQLLSTVPAGPARRPGIRDVVGPLRALYDAIGSDEELQNFHLVSGGFLAWMDAQGLAPSGLTVEHLKTYYEERLTNGTKRERAVRVHVQTIAALTRELAGSPRFQRYGFPALPSPWSRPDVLPGDDEIALLLAEYDGCVAPWLRGEASATGEHRAAFLARLDAEAQTACPGQARRARIPVRLGRRITQHQKNALAEAGFLTAKKTWGEPTIQVFRKTMCGMARRLVLETDEPIICIGDLCDPTIVENMLVLAEAANPDEKGYGSSYCGSFVQRLLKIAEVYLGLSAGDVAELRDLRREYDPKRSTGIAPRNRAKLELFTDQKIEAFFGLSSTLLHCLENEIAERRRRAISEGNASQTADLYDQGLACRVMRIVAHDILLARAPRTANVAEARLDWIRWRDGQACLVVPAAMVKGRGAAEADLVIPLGERQSELLQDYVAEIRVKALLPGDDANPYLFPSPRKAGQPHRSLLMGVCREVHKHVGIRINPHLYRHLIGWIWLRDEPSALPMVQRLLGHKSINTTMNYYAEIADQTAIDAWQKFVPGKVKT